MICLFLMELQQRKFTLYPPTKTTIEVESEEWIDDDIDIWPIFVTSKTDEED